MGFYEERLLPMITATVDAEMELPYFKMMLDGTLPIENFKFQCKQNYNYLIEYAKAWSVGFAKCPDFESMKIWYEIVKETVEWEIPFYKEHWQKVLDVDFATMEETIMANVKRSYTSHELARSWEGDLAEQVTALLPCDFVYWHMGQRLVSLCKVPFDELSDAGKLYRDWMSFYTKGWFVEVCEMLIKLIDKLVEYKSERELAKIEEIFAVGCNYEYLSWRDMYYKQETWPLENIFPKKFNQVERFKID